MKLFSIFFKEEIMRKASHNISTTKSAGLAIRTLRARLGISQNELANLVTVTSKTVWMWEKGLSSPNRKQKAKIIRMLIKLNYLEMIAQIIGGGLMKSDRQEKIVDSLLGQLTSLPEKVMSEVACKLVEYQRRREIATAVLHETIELDEPVPTEYLIFKEYYKKQQWDVVNDYGEIIVAHVKFKPLYYQRILGCIGIAKFKLAAYAEALGIFDKAISDCTNTNLLAKLFLDKSSVLVRLHRLKEAKKAALKAIQIKKNNASAFINLLAISVLNGDSVAKQQRWIYHLCSILPSEMADENSKIRNIIQNDPDLEPIKDEIPVMVESSLKKLRNKVTWAKAVVYSLILLAYTLGPAVKNLDHHLSKTPLDNANRHQEMVFKNTIRQDLQVAVILESELCKEDLNAVSQICESEDNVIPLFAVILESELKSQEMTA